MIAYTTLAGPSLCGSPRFNDLLLSPRPRTKHSSLTSRDAGTPGESVAVVKAGVSQQRYSLSAITIPRLSISGETDTADNVPGESDTDWSLQVSKYVSK